MTIPCHSEHRREDVPFLLVTNNFMEPGCPMFSSSDVNGNFYNYRCKMTLYCYFILYSILIVFLFYVKILDTKR